MADRRIGIAADVNPQIPATGKPGIKIILFNLFYFVILFSMVCLQFYVQFNLVFLFPAKICRNR